MTSEFDKEVAERIAANGMNGALIGARDRFLTASIAARYSYNFSWLGRPIIQYPQDIVGFQEIVWQTRPDVIVETGIAHGGSLILSASLLALLDLCDLESAGELPAPPRHPRRVVGVDIDIRANNRTAIEAHPIARRITLIEGSSVAQDIVERVRAEVGNAARVLVALDSNHTHDHVRQELGLYAPMVTPGSYCIVFDTVVESLPQDLAFDRPWGPGDNPMTAVHDWLKDNPEFSIDRQIEDKLMLTVAPSGFLRRAG
jgi:cephalosporin hydroxylase